MRGRRSIRSSALKRKQKKTIPFFFFLNSSMRLSSGGDGSHNIISNTINAIYRHHRRAEAPPPPPPASSNALLLCRRASVGVAAVLGIAVTFLAARQLSRLVAKRRRRRELARCDASGQLYLFMLPRSSWAPSLSPSCTRVEALLRASGTSYVAVETMDAFGAPHERLPFLAYRGDRVDEMPAILDYISTTFHGLAADDELTRDDRAVGAALRRTLEYSMEPFLYRIAFIEHPSLAAAQISKALHLSRITAYLAVYRYRAALHHQLSMTAYGALVHEQYECEFLRDCEAVELQIGSKKYLFSDEIVTSYDCAVFALLVPFTLLGQYTALREACLAVAESPILRGYVCRMAQRLFPDVKLEWDAKVESRSSSSSSSIAEHQAVS